MPILCCFVPRNLQTWHIASLLHMVVARVIYVLNWLLTVNKKNLAFLQKLSTDKNK